jgi:hypothetical protein
MLTKPPQNWMFCRSSTGVLLFSKLLFLFNNNRKEKMGSRR